TEDTRRRTTLTELLSISNQEADVDSVVEKLTMARLLTVAEDEVGTVVVDVAHEALIRAWSQLQSWIDQDREALRIHRRLTETAEEWAANGRDQSYLYTGARSAAASEWAEAHADALNTLEQEFL